MGRLLPAIGLMLWMGLGGGGLAAAADCSRAVAFDGFCIVASQTVDVVPSGEGATAAADPRKAKATAVLDKVLDRLARFWFRLYQNSPIATTGSVFLLTLALLQMAIHESISQGPPSSEEEYTRRRAIMENAVRLLVIGMVVGGLGSLANRMW